MRKQCPACLCAHNEPTELCAEDERLAQQVELVRAIAVWASVGVLAVVVAVVVG